VPGQDILTVTFLDEVTDELVQGLKGLPEVREVGREDEHTARFILAHDTVPIEGITEVARQQKHKIKSMTLLEPTLEDVFIHFTGRALRDAAAGEVRYQMPSMMR
jgi:ABC-2 type transport system ATP-binding protein